MDANEIVGVNFDFIIIVIYLAFLFLGFLFGGHKQMILSINIVLPFVLIDAFGGDVSNFIFRSDLYQNYFVQGLLVNTGLKQTQLVGMGISYLLSYMVIILFVMTLSNFLAVGTLAEKIKIYFGKFNSYIGLLFASLNFYVLIFFILMPMIALNMISPNTQIANLILQNPPSFSKFGKTTSKTSKVKLEMDGVSEFIDLIVGEGSDEYYQKIFVYQQEILDLEVSFKNDYYDILHNNTKELIKDPSLVNSIQIPVNCRLEENIGNPACPDIWDPDAESDNDPVDYKDLLGKNDLAMILVDDAVYNKILLMEAGNSDLLNSLTTLRNKANECKGLVMWFDSDPVLADLEEAGTISPSDMTVVINSFKENFDSTSPGTGGSQPIDIIGNSKSQDVKDDMTLVRKGIEMFDLFYSWKTHCIDVAAADTNTEPEDVSTCIALDLDDDPTGGSKYDFVARSQEMLDLALDGGKLSYLMYQFNIDYPAGIFDPYIEDSEKLTNGFKSAYEFSENYVTYYAPIASSIVTEFPLEAQFGPTIRIGIAVARYKFDLVEVAEDIPILAAAINDLGITCFLEAEGDFTDPTTGAIPSTQPCAEGPKAWLAEILIKAYFMVDDDGSKREITQEIMDDFVDTLKVLLNNNVITKNFIYEMAEQIAFFPMPVSTEEDAPEVTLLDYLLTPDSNGHIYLAVNVLESLSDEKDLFGEAFIAKVSNLLI